METSGRVTADSPLILSSPPQAQKLNEDHRLDCSPSERARVLALGGKLAHAADNLGRPSGPLRLWPGGMALARTVGDSDVGSCISASPYTSTLDMPEGCAGATVVLGSDGVWDAFSPQVAAKVSVQLIAAPNNE